MIQCAARANNRMATQYVARRNLVLSPKGPGVVNRQARALSPLCCIASLLTNPLAPKIPRRRPRDVSRGEHCQGQSKTRPLWRSKSRPVEGCGCSGIVAVEGPLERSGSGPFTPRCVWRGEFSLAIRRWGSFTTALFETVSRSWQNERNL